MVVSIEKLNIVDFRKHTLLQEKKDILSDLLPEFYKMGQDEYNEGLGNEKIVEIDNDNDYDIDLQP